MATEDLTGAGKFIDDLVATNPVSSDLVSSGDEHLRGVKNVLKNSFGAVTGAVTATHTELNYTDGVTSAIQTQIDGKQASDAQLTDVAGLAVTNGNFIVGDGSNFVAESGATARTSLGLAIGTNVQAYYATGYESLPVIKSANYTAVAGNTIIVSAGSITITLPASPSVGDTVIVKDGTGAAETTTWTVGRNGSNIASSGSDLTFDKNWAEITMTYINSSIGWSV
jgi:hypothetical protein